MIHRLINWAVSNRLVVILLAIALAAFGTYSFLVLNVEAYPDSAPAIVEVIAQYPELRPRKSSGRSRFRSRSLWRACQAWTSAQQDAVRAVALAQPVCLCRRLFRAKAEVLESHLMGSVVPPSVVPRRSPRPLRPAKFIVMCLPLRPTPGSEHLTLWDASEALNDWRLEKDFRRVRAESPTW